MRTLLTLLLITAAAAADDPPFVAAAKEREAKAKAFEVTLTVRKEWKGVTPIWSNEKKDFEGTGTAKLAVDGDRYWFEIDEPELIGMQDRLRRQLYVAAFDGRWYFLRMQSEIVNGEPMGPIADTNAIQGEVHSEWAGLFDPLRWVFRGASPGSPLGPVSSIPKVNSYSPTRFGQGMGEEVIGGRKCVEVVKITNGFRDEVRRTIWLDAVDHRPVRSYGTTIQYRPHPVLGRMPSGWITEPDVWSDTDPSRTTVTVDSFELRDSIPNERFVIQYPAGSKVERRWRNVIENLIATEDGSFVPDVGDDPKPPQPPAGAEPPSLQLSLWVVGGVVAVFVVLVVLLKRLARNRTDDSSDSGSSPPLLT